MKRYCSVNDWWLFVRCVCSKVQARFAFATYLTCIQQRLVSETRSQVDVDTDTANEQLVCLFLVQYSRVMHGFQSYVKYIMSATKVPQDHVYHSIPHHLDHRDLPRLLLRPIQWGPSVSLWRDPDDVSHCRILSPDKTEWRLISATLCGWGRCFVADQLW